jgi:hypothetical protein
MSTTDLPGRLSCLTLTRFKGLPLAERPDAHWAAARWSARGWMALAPEFMDTFARLTEKSQLQLYPFNS